MSFDHFPSVADISPLAAIIAFFDAPYPCPVEWVVCDEDSDNADASCPLETEGEIRQTGIYKAIVKLHAKVEVSFVFDVIAEKK